MEEALKYEEVFSFMLFGYRIPVMETVVVSWAAMVLIVFFAFIMTRRLAWRPSGAQAVLETAVGFLNKFSKDKFGEGSRYLGHYIATLFLFLCVTNLLPVFSPVEIFGLEPPFSIKPPARDINVTASLAVISILLVLICGLRARGFTGWLRHLAHPVPMMIPFNLMEYGTRLISLALRLFGNVLGAFVLMRLIEGLIPVALPMVLSLYFDFFDGVLQAGIFVFLTSLYIAEAVEVHAQ